MKDIIRNFLNKRGYEIIKQAYVGDKYPNLSKDKSVYFCETPLGNYSLPLTGIEKDAVTAVLIRGKLFEPEILDIAKKYIKKGTAVIDIGANFGQMSIEFSKMTGDTGCVYSFEAQEFVFNFLEKNIKNNGIKNVILYKNAVWNKDNEVLYFPQSDMSSSAPYSGNSVTGSISTVPVKTITIDSLNIQEPISFMKIDIEGADIFALQGAKNTILKNKMPIVFEYLQHMQDDFKISFQDYVDFAESINYKFSEIIMGINYVMLPK